MPPAATQPNVVPIRPARPILMIDGARQASLEAGLIAMELGDQVDGIGSAELGFGNWGSGDTPGFQYFDRKLLDFGKAIKVQLDDKTLFEGRLTAIVGDFPDGGPPTIAVLAEDRAQDLRMKRRTRVFEQAGLADVARRVASDHGLTPSIDFSGTTAPTLAQLNQSDLAFLHDLARREDAQVWVDGTTLHVARTRPDTRVELRWAGTLRQFHVEADLAHQRTAIVAAGWDVSAKAAATHRTEAAAISSELGQTESGASILEAKLGSRVDTVAHANPRDDAEARALADARFRAVARRFVTGHGVATTSAALKVGATLALTGLGPLFDGDYRATSVTHRFDIEEGLRSEFACERPGLGRA